MKMLRITLEGKSYEVGVEVLDEGTARAPFISGFASPTAVVKPAAVAVQMPPAPAVSEGGRLVVCPMAGLVFKCLVKPGDVVALHQVVMVLDAMKMETPISAPTAGTVRTVLVREGDAVEEGSSLLQIDGDPQ